MDTKWVMSIFKLKVRRQSYINPFLASNIRHSFPRHWFSTFTRFLCFNEAPCRIANIVTRCYTQQTIFPSTRLKWLNGRIILHRKTHCLRRFDLLYREDSIHLAFIPWHQLLLRPNDQKFRCQGVYRSQGWGLPWLRWHLLHCMAGDISRSKTVGHAGSHCIWEQNIRCVVNLVAWPHTGCTVRISLRFKTFFELACRSNMACTSYWLMFDNC